MRDPRVSVLISTYNRVELLPRALEGLASQTFTDFETVIVNDGGADPTPATERFVDRLDIRVVHHPSNLGVTATQNTAIAAARGEAIALLADDDRYLPDHLQTLVEATREDPLLVPYTDGVQVTEDEAGNVLGRTVIPVPPVFDRDRLLIENYIPAIALLIPRVALTTVGVFDPALSVLEDWELWLRLSAEYEFRRVDAVTFEYFVRGGRSNITSREVARFHRCMQMVYARHPVAADSTIARQRERLLQSSRNRADVYLFDHTVAIATDPDPDIVLDALRRVVEAMGDRTYEVVVVTGRTDPVEQLAAQISGDVSFVYSTADPRQELAGAAKVRAAGRRTHLIPDPAQIEHELAALTRT